MAGGALSKTEPWLVAGGEDKTEMAGLLCAPDDGSERVETELIFMFSTSCFRVVATTSSAFTFESNAVKATF